MSESRNPETIQREIESSRAQLAATLDRLAERTSPQRLAGVARDRATTFAASPPGMAILGAVAACDEVLVACLINEDAVVDALSPLGVRHIDMPMSRSKVWRAIRDAEARSR